MVHETKAHRVVPPLSKPELVIIQQGQSREVKSLVKIQQTTVFQKLIHIDNNGKETLRGDASLWRRLDTGFDICEYISYSDLRSVLACCCTALLFGPP